MDRMMLVALVALVGTGCSAAAGQMTGDGAGCKDKAEATKLAALADGDPAYIEIWAKGMKDQSCRGYSAGQEVNVDERAGGLACVRAADDDACFWVAESIAP